MRHSPRTPTRRMRFFRTVVHIAFAMHIPWQLIVGGRGHVTWLARQTKFPKRTQPMP